MADEVQSSISNRQSSIVNSLTSDSFLYTLLEIGNLDVCRCFKQWIGMLPSRPKTLLEAVAQLPSQDTA